MNEKQQYNAISRGHICKYFGCGGKYNIQKDIKIIKIGIFNNFCKFLT